MPETKHPTIALPELRSEVLDNLDAAIRSVIISPKFEGETKPVVLRYKYEPGEAVETGGFGRMRIKQEGTPDVTIGWRMACVEEFGKPSGGWYPVERTLREVDYEFPPDMPQHVESEIERVLRGFKVGYKRDIWGKTRDMEIRTKIEPGYREFVHHLVDDIRNPLVIFPQEAKSPGETWTITDTQTEEGITTELRGTYRYMGQVKSPVLRDVSYIAVELSLKMSGEMEETGFYRTLTGGAAGKGVILFGTETGQEVAVYAEMQLNQVIRGKEWVQDVELQQEFTAEIAAQRL